jgi:hypothetical protein
LIQIKEAFAYGINMATWTNPSRSCAAGEAERTLMIDDPTLIRIILVLIVGIFLAGCVWRMSHVERDRNPSRD